MKRFFTILALSVLTATSHAAIINGSFEQGMSGWEKVGLPNEANYLAKGTASDGQYSAVMKAFDTFPILANGASISEFIGAAPGAFVGVEPAKGASYDGAAIKQTFFANAGQTVSFDWRFGLELTPGATRNTVFYAVNGMPVSLLDTSLASNFSENTEPFMPIFMTDLSYAEFYSLVNVTQITNIQFPILTSGFYTLAFGAISNNVGMNDSVLFIDNVKLIGEVPEPTSLALFGIAGLALFARRRNKK
jgi:hypothetical protein